MTKRLAFMLAVALGACAGSGSGYGTASYGASVTVTSPDLVYVDDDVQVVADADQPVFYSDNSYWMYNSGRWYRSQRYDRDWVYVSEPAPRVRRIREPTAYVHYRARHQEARTQPPRTDYRGDRDYRNSGPEVRDHRNEPQQPLQPTQPPQPATPYPRPPQQEPVQRDQRPLPPPAQVEPTPPRSEPRHDERRPNPPGRVEHDQRDHDDAKDHDRDKHSDEGRRDDKKEKDKQDKKHDH